jgi:hypothetical protein
LFHTTFPQDIGPGQNGCGTDGCSCAQKITTAKGFHFFLTSAYGNQDLSNRVGTADYKSDD